VKFDRKNHCFIYSKGSFDWIDTKLCGGCSVVGGMGYANFWGIGAVGEKAK